MVDTIRLALTFATALGCGLVAGAFFAFSSFVMRALARLPAAHGVAAMQSINIVVINRWFMTALFGTALAGLVVAGWSVVRWQHPGSGWALAGGLLYVFGTVVATIAFNVPKNERLAKLDPTSAEAAAYWPEYVATWTAWNTVRTVAALIAMALLIIAIRVQHA